MKKATILLALLCITACMQQRKSEELAGPESESFVFADSRDGKEYKVVKLNSQTWMAENLNYNAEGSKCYDNEAQNCDTYGRLYDWETAMKACPEGWHLPSDEEWKTLTRAVALSGGKAAGKRLKATSGWNDFEGKSGNGSDDFGFSALPGGSNQEGSFKLIGDSGSWWSASKHKRKDGAYWWSMGSPSEGVYHFSYLKSMLNSVRCLRDF